MVVERAFLREFRAWWPFVREKLATGAWIRFTVSLEVKGRSQYFVQGSLECSDKVKTEGGGS